MFFSENHLGREYGFAAFFAVKARFIVPLTDTGRDTTKPAILDNHCLVIRNGKIEDITPRPSCPVIDLGDVAILPALVNAHTHLQYSWLAGKTLWGHGFTPWLQSLIPFVLQNASQPYGSQEQLTALEKAATSLAGSIVGDIGGSLPGALSAVQTIACAQDINIIYFCEWFGYDQAHDYWPPRCMREIQCNPYLCSHSAPAGHALYSTHIETLKKSHAWCRRHGRIFTFHLAESPEETELLLHGTGPLAELYRPHVLPPAWTPPGKMPLDYAMESGILGPGTLAVHATQLDRREIARLARTGSAICLCPRSNYNLAVGMPNVPELLNQKVLCCLGTDGLTSNSDLDVRNEAYFLREKQDIPLPVLWRMATVNGASALGTKLALAKGQPARFSVWPDQ